MARAGEILVATLESARGHDPSGREHGRARQGGRALHPFQGATPAFKGYRGFPGSICASPNALIVHGIPGPYRLKGGDIISIDVGVTLDGWVADAARTFPVGEVGKQRQTCWPRPEAVAARRRGRVSRGQPHGRCLERGSQQVAGERRTGDRALARGHGVDVSMHGGPQGCRTMESRGRGRCSRRAWSSRSEPMTTAGRPAVRMGGDGWAIFSQDGSPAAHFEFTVAITGEGPRILTPGISARGPRGADRAGRGERRLRGLLAGSRPYLGPAPGGPTRPPYQTELASMGESCSRARFVCAARKQVHDPVAAAATAARAGRRNPAAERDHEGKTVGQADVREVQDHPRNGVVLVICQNKRHKQRQGVIG